MNKASRIIDKGNLYKKPLKATWTYIGLVAVAVKRKTITVYALLFVLIASMVGLGFVNKASANDLLPAPISPNQDRPSITVSFASNKTMLSENDSLSFVVTIPDSWTEIIVLSDSVRNYPLFMGTITRVSCVIDSDAVYDNNTAFGGFVDVFANGWDPYAHLADIHSIPKVLYYSIPIGGLREGSHTVVTTVSAYTVWHDLPNGFLYEHYNIVSNSTDTILVCSTPTINLTLQSKTYISNALPLSIEVNETFPMLGLSWMGFSLDNQANVTLNGNSTLTDLAEGNHTIVIYANDTYGNMGKSDIAYFTVSLPAPTPTPAPIPNLTETPSPSPTVPEIPLAAVAFTFLTVTILVGILIRKRKREP